MCLAVAVAAILIAVPGQASANDIPKGRSIWGVGGPEMFSELSFQTDTKNPDLYLASFSDWRFQIDYVKSGIEPSSVYISDIATGIYTPGTMNWRMNLSVLEVFEFKNNGSASFGPEDTLISNVDIAGQNYSMFSSYANTLNWGVRETYTAVSEDGLVTLVFVTNTDYIFNDLGGDTDPTEIHLNVRISRYNFSNESDSIGLRVKVGSQSTMGIVFVESEKKDALNITTSEPFAGGLISWEKWAYVDGVASPPWGVSSSWEDGDLTLAYPKGNTIMHDIVFKVRSNMTYYTDPDSLNPNPTVYIVGLGMAATAVAVTVVLFRRGRE